MHNGQLSLETAIQFVIIIVVIATVISFLFNTIPDDTEDFGGETRSVNKIRSTCEQHCTDWSYASHRNAPQEALRYCTARFGADTNDNGNIDAINNGFLSYCEDGIHCFNVHTCTSDGETLDVSTCIDIMCDYYQENEGMSPTDASTNISALYQLDKAQGNRGAGTCSLDTLEGPSGNPTKTWWSEYFQGGPPNLC